METDQTEDMHGLNTLLTKRESNGSKEKYARLLIFQSKIYVKRILIPLPMSLDGMSKGMERFF